MTATPGGGPPECEAPAPHHETGTFPKTLRGNERTSIDAAGLESRQVAWWPVHEFLEAVAAQANFGPLPLAGTPAWQALAAGDPRKMLSLAFAGEHHVLRVEIGQQAMAEASRAVAGAADWSRVAREVTQLHSFREAHPWARREVS